MKTKLKKIGKRILSVISAFQGEGMLGLIFLGWTVWLLHHYGFSLIKIFGGLIIIGLLTIAYFVYQGWKEKKNV